MPRSRRASRACCRWASATSRGCGSSPHDDTRRARLRRMEPGIAQQLDVVASMAIAMLLGGLIGYERELKRRPAGFRTHMLVAGASALLVGVGRVTVEVQGASP